MMPGRAPTSPQSWYRNLSVCSRRQTFTTVTCLAVLTVCFTYFSFYSKSWIVRLIPEKSLLGASQLGHEGLNTHANEAVNSSTGRSSPSSTWRGVGVAGNGPNIENRSLVSRQRHIDALASALNIPNGKSVDSGNTTSGLRGSTGISPELGILPNIDQTDNRPDSNSIEGSLRWSTNAIPDDEQVNALDTQYQDNNITDNRGRNTVDHGLMSSEVSDYITSASTTVGNATDSTLSSATDFIHLTSPVTPAGRGKDNANIKSSLLQILTTAAQRITTEPRSSTGRQTPPSTDTQTAVSTNHTVSDEPGYDDHANVSSNQNSHVKTTTEKEQIIYDPRDVDLLSMEPLQFSRDYKNPCWVENVTTWYMDNVYLEIRNVRAVLTRMSAILRLRQEKGDRHRVRCLPYFFIIGQPKCGSTDLYEKLTAHPETVRPPTKEPHWWSRARLGRHRSHGHLVSLADYVDIFDYAGYNIEQHPVRSADTGVVHHKMITGEGSMSTFWDNDHWWAMLGNENTTEPRVLNPDYIHHLLPDAKLILILRNPTTRMYSDYLYFKKQDKLPLDFHNDVVNAIGVYQNCSKDSSMRSCAYNASVNGMAKIRLRVGMYSVYMRDWLSVFPRERFFIARTEDYATKPREVLTQIYSFLNLQELSASHLSRILSRKKANTRRAKDTLLGDMLPETRVLLNDFYRPFNEELAALLKDDQFLWQDGGTT